MESHTHQQQHHHHKQGILKQPIEHQHSSEHVTFDEEVIAEHDKFRGTRQKISEPKTPYEQEHQGEEDEHHSQGSHHDVEMHDHTHPQNMEDEIKQHLKEAERNKMLNAQLQKDKANVAQQQHHDFQNELQQRLDQTHQAQNDEEKKHQEFLKKRKEHYKNELLSAKQLLRQAQDEDDEE